MLLEVSTPSSPTYGIWQEEGWREKQEQEEQEQEEEEQEEEGNGESQQLTLTPMQTFEPVWSWRLHLLCCEQVATWMLMSCLHSLRRRLPGSML